MTIPSITKYALVISFHFIIFSLVHLKEITVEPITILYLYIHFKKILNVYITRNLGSYTQAQLKSDGRFFHILYFQTYNEP